MTHKRISRLQILICGIILLPSVLLGDTIPGVPRIRQSHTYWCWAAASQCILRYSIPGYSKTQAEIASVITSENVAPPPESIVTCLEENGMEVGLHATMVGSPISWQEMKAEADAKRPYIMLIRWATGSYHCNVFAGYYTDSTRIRYMDPAGSWVTRTYQGSLIIDGGRGVWERTIKVEVGSVAARLQPRSSQSPEVFLSVRNGAHRVQADIGSCNAYGLRLEVFDASGACAFQSEVGGSLLSVPMSGTSSSGMYYMRVTPLHSSRSHSSSPVCVIRR